MKRVGIIGAMEPEVQALIRDMEASEQKTKAGMKFYAGRLYGVPAVVVQSGIGKVNAAVCAQILADDYQVGALINTGVAGSLQASINIGDIVLSTDALQHDMDATQFGYALGVIPQMACSDFPADLRLLQLAETSCRKVNPDIQVFSGRVLSGDQFVASSQKKQWLVETYGGYCTEMEGAAIAQTAYLNQIPFLIIRGISDKADDSAHMSYDEFLRLAVENSLRLLRELLPKI